MRTAAASEIWVRVLERGCEWYREAPIRDCTEEDAPERENQKVDTIRLAFPSGGGRSRGTKRKRATVEMAINGPIKMEFC